MMTCDLAVTGTCTILHSTIAALTPLGLSVAAVNAALGAALESIAHDDMLISRLRHTPPMRWRGAWLSSLPAAWIWLT